MTMVDDLKVEHLLPGLSFIFLALFRSLFLTNRLFSVSFFSFWFFIYTLPIQPVIGLLLNLNKWSGLKQ